MSDSTALPPLPLSSPSLPPQRSPKDKHESLNVLSPSTSSGPRPLHLPLGSVIGSSTSPSTPNFSSSHLSPGPSSSIAEYDVDADHRSSVTSASKSSPTQKAITTSRSTSRAVPAPLSPGISGLRKHNSRRQSSISYISSSSSPNGHSPSSPQFTFNNKRQSMDAAATLVRSPLSSVHPTFGDAFEPGGGSGLARSNSLGGGVSRAGRGSKSPRSPNIGERERDRDRSSTGSIVPGQHMKHLKERPPVTLAEKHAELLHFIAQKESKCLELRSQLAVHEAELLQLKRKWERIVNRGFEKALSPISTTASSSSKTSNAIHKPTLPSHGPFSKSPDDNNLFSPSSSITSSPPSSSSYPAAGPGAGAAVVLEGIKEGVQGVSRFIAAGLESIVNVGPPSATSPTANEAANAKSEGTTPAPPLQLKLGSAATSSIKSKRQSYLGHEQKESQSSSGSSTRTSGTFSSLLSAGSAASTTTSTNSSASAGTSGIDSVGGVNHSSSASDASTTKETDADDDFGDFETGQPVSRSSPNSSMDDEQVLMVHDTGATPTMSPNPAFEKRRRRKGERVQVQVEKLVFTPEDGSDDKEQQAEELSWDDDAWGDSEQPLSSSLSSAASSQGHQRRSQPQAQAQPRQKQQSQSSHSTSTTSGPKSPLAPMSSIPGLSMGMNMSMNTPSAQQVSSWVGSVGKKWGEIAKGGSTFAKNQKRASVLLSDMQQSIVSALGSPVSLSSTPQTASSLNTKTSSTSTSSQTPSTPSFSSNASHTSHVAPSSASSSPSYHNSTSLLDGSDDESYGESSIVGINITPVMVPDSLNGRAQAEPTSKTPQLKKVATGGVKENEDEDEWNW